jgi:hypothetical protein
MLWTEWVANFTNITGWIMIECRCGQDKEVTGNNFLHNLWSTHYFCITFAFVFLNSYNLIMEKITTQNVSSQMTAVIAKAMDKTQ